MASNEKNKEENNLRQEEEEEEEEANEVIVLGDEISSNERHANNDVEAAECLEEQQGKNVGGTTFQNHQVSAKANSMDSKNASSEIDDKFVVVAVHQEQVPSSVDAAKLSSMEANNNNETSNKNNIIILSSEEEEEDDDDGNIPPPVELNRSNAVDPRRLQQVPGAFHVVGINNQQQQDSSTTTPSMQNNDFLGAATNDNTARVRGGGGGGETSSRSEGILAAVATPPQQQQEEPFMAELVHDENDNDDPPPPAVVGDDHHDRISAENNHDEEEEQRVSPHQQQVHRHLRRGRRYQSSTELVVEGRPVKDNRHFHSFSLFGILLLVTVVIVMALGLSGAFDDDDDEKTKKTREYYGDEDPSVVEGSTTIDSTTSITASEEDDETSSNTLPMLDRIRKRGSLRAGLHIFPELINEEGEVDGRDAAMTRAIAAGVLGPEFRVDWVDTPLHELFASLANGTVDLMLFGASHTMEREVFMGSTQSNFHFSTPYMYDGIRAAGDPFYVRSCADRGFKHLGECSGLKVCVVAETTHHKAVQRYLPSRNIVPALWDADQGGVYQGYIDGRCNVIVEEGFNLARPVVMAITNGAVPANMTIGSNYWSNEPLSAVTRTDDPQFSDFVSAIISALITAEHQNITQETASSFPQTAEVFGEEYKDAFRNAVAAGGNYGEIYSKYTQDWIPRTALNLVNRGTTGLLYSHPFGFIENERKEAILGPQLGEIMERGKLNCGIQMNRPGFASRVEKGYTGMDVDYCRALSASLFFGDENAVDFVEIEESSDGYLLLHEGTIDVMAGATRSLQSDVRERTTGLGYSFSQPYFYGYSPQQDNLCLATRQDDSDWASFVYWTVAASIYAEERGIDSDSSFDMPLVFVYGSSLKRMFRDSILRLGNYGQVYERNLEAFYPRGGRNVLNVAPTGPQHYLLPGMIH